MPWSRSASSSGFGDNGSWLPQPPLFAELSVEAQSGVAWSTLELCRKALVFRRIWQTGDSSVEWVAADSPHVLHFRRANGWAGVVNFATTQAPLPDGEVLLPSDAAPAGELPGKSAVWLLRP